MTDRELLKKALHRIEYHYEGDPDDKEAIEAIKARLAQPELEHMAQFKFQDYGWWRDEEGKLKLGTTPQKKEWVGLTDEEVEEAGKLNIEGERMLPYSFARAIGAKLKEKNT